jgi:hypothetical protein
MQIEAVTIVTLLLAVSSPAAGLPVRYDQRQEGDLNVHANLENFLIVLIPNNGASSLLDFIPLKKDANRHGPKQSVVESDDNTVHKYVVPTVAVKSASPYKVDLDKNSTVSKGGEVLIGQSPPAALSKTESEPPTTASSDDESSVQVPTEETNKQDIKAHSDKAGAVTDSPVAKKDGEIKDEVSVVDSEPQKSVKSSKAIGVAVKVPATALRKTSQDDIPVIDFSPKSVKSFRFEYGNADSEELKPLRSGAEGQHRHTKER